MDKFLLTEKRKLDINLFNYIFNNKIRNVVNEAFGHPLISNKDFKWINLIYDFINTVNNEILSAKVIVEKNNAQLLDTIKLSLDDLGFTNALGIDNGIIDINVKNLINYDLSVEDYIFLENSFSSGSYKFNLKNKENAKITINCIAINGKVIPHTLIPSFLHELIHSYEELKRNDNKTFKHFINAFIDFKLTNNSSEKFIGILFKEEIQSLKNVLYRLFNGEDNALIGNLLGEFITYEIFSYNDFEKYKNKLKPFKILEQLENDINIIKNINDERLFQFIKSNAKILIGKQFNEDGTFEYITRNIISSDPIKIKKLFIKILEKKYLKLYKKLLSTSGKYIVLFQNYYKTVIETVET